MTKKNARAATSKITSIIDPSDISRNQSQVQVHRIKVLEKSIDRIKCYKIVAGFPNSASSELKI